LVVAGHTGFRLEPALAARVEADDGTPQPTLLEKLRLLEDEDPQLHIRHLPQTGELLAQVMGPVQLEILEELLRERFNIRARFSKPDVLYRETLCAPVMGYGHYEPLRHYAEVQLRLEPAPRGSGISFASECHVDNLPVNYQKLIQTHVFERAYRGVLTGSPIADIRMVLAAGRAHLKHTEGGDFREATSRAIRQGLMSGQCMLLEPWYAFDLMVPATSVGMVLSDISAMFGTVTAQETLGDTARIQGRGPVSEFADYSVQLRAVTHGEGGGSFQLDGYEPCHNQEEVIARMGYDPCADTEQTPNSVFCSHGAGYTVLWNEAKAHMHCEIEKR
ncbi:MAG: TetM/TetW/TetO/TetS family tetracycline resistance ribosomal protection protein, partial [Clostridia bacterium]|nr:TetM/TetW/TetO/TetS family tetracycline resistance ribosomal protection protein [Clostridia bacterium]